MDIFFPCRTACNLEEVPSAVDDNTIAEATFTSIQPGTSLPTGSRNCDHEQFQWAAQIYITRMKSLCRRQKSHRKIHKKKRKANDVFEQQLSYLQQKIAKSEAFGMSIGITLDRMTRQAAA